MLPKLQPKIIRILLERIPLREKGRVGSGRVGSGRCVLGKNVPSVLSTTRGLEYYPKTSSTVFPNTDLLVGEYHIYNNLIFII